MNLTFTISRTVVFTVFLLLPGFSHCQNLIESRKTSYYTYIYKISDQEAGKIYRNGIWKVDQSFFHTKIDSFPTGAQDTFRLLPGHYLKTFSEANRQKVLISTIRDFDIFILNNNTDLCIQIYDHSGNIISDAKVKAGIKTLPFNSNTKSYVDKKSNFKGTLKVRYNGITAFYEIKRQYYNPFLLRNGRRIVYGTPLKYAWLPVNYFIHLPYDAVKSIVTGWPNGTIRKTLSVVRNTTEKIAEIFEDEYDYRFRNKHTGYMVFNKPKYHLDDTVMFKAFITTRDGKPLNKSVKVILQNEEKDILLTELKPYSNGGYEYRFLLHDSLNLKLDQSYPVSLILKKGKEYIRGSFEFEEYELSKLNLSVRPDTTIQYRNHRIRLYIKGTDENDLMLPDARVEVLLTPNNILAFHDNHAFIPDTLDFLQQKLDANDESEIQISDSAFPKADFSYNIMVRLLTSDNESVSLTKEVIYYYQKDTFDFHVESDSIQIQFKQNGKIQSKTIRIDALDNFGNATGIFEGSTPCKIHLNPYYSKYRITSENKYTLFDLSSELPLIQCYTERTDDSIKIAIDNPRKILFNYTIYKKNKKISSGHTDNLKYFNECHSKENYFISLNYLWAGKTNQETYRIPLNENKFNIYVNEPRIVYPGQKTFIDIRVTDYKGNPVEGADLTAFSLTKKFNYSPPVLPVIEKERKNKTVINNFHFNESEPDYSNGLLLDYNVWKTMAHIDSIEYYKFLYPGESVYKFDYFTTDSSTQFAPFVFSRGNSRPVHVIYIDSQPVYLSWMTLDEPYSFPVDSGFHQVVLRTAKDKIIIDRLHFPHKKKLIISLDIDSTNAQKRYVKNKLSDYEKSSLEKYILPYRNTFNEQFAWISNKNRFYLLNEQSGYRIYQGFTGPVSGSVNLYTRNSNMLSFNHEPEFQYEFNPGLIKMRSIEDYQFPSRLNSYQYNISLNETCLTYATLQEKYQHYLDAKRQNTARYNYPSKTNAGYGRLSLNHPSNEPAASAPLNILVLNYSNYEFLRVYPGNTSLIHQLSPGRHRLIFFYPGLKYHIEDSVMIKADGLTYLKIEPPLVLKCDEFSKTISKMIEKAIFEKKPTFLQEEKELKQIYNSYQQHFQYRGEGRIIEGIVTDRTTGEALPGVNIIIKGTAMGTITDLNGYYSLNVPVDKDMLIFQFIGYINEERFISNERFISVALEQDVTALQEVVVIGYGTMKKRDVTASIAQISTNYAEGILGVSGNISQELQGRMAGVEIASVGAATEIRIRGVSTASFDSAPLFIIDGNVFSGDISKLDPALIKNIAILKDPATTAMYGARGANGVVIIETSGYKATLNSRKVDLMQDDFISNNIKSNSIRKNFRDYAFWQPALKTDKNGKTRFEITFPDDVTSWETFYLTMDHKKHSGQTNGLIKSYKPLMAQLSVPRFLLQGDTTYVIGKTLNYLNDSVEITTRVSIGDSTILSKKRLCYNSVIDTLKITAVDSIKIKYTLEKSDGYFDGEERNIAVFPIGMKETRGSFYVLDKDTSVCIRPETGLGEATLYARADILEVMEDEIDHIIYYQYNCNEQLASKLKVLLTEKKICDFRKKRYKNEDAANRIIRALVKNQNKEGLWGWWNKSESSIWISLHVLEALMQAEMNGFKVQINKNAVIDQLLWELQSTRDFYSRIRMLRILALMNGKIDYATYIADLERNTELRLNGILHIIELKQICGLKYDLDTLEYFRQYSQFGNIYYHDNYGENGLLNNEVQNTILAYRIMRNDSSEHQQILKKIRNYFLEKRNNGHWTNTYESAQILETIIPDLLGADIPSIPSLEICGDINRMINEFPFEMKLKENQTIEVLSHGDYPVYLTSYQKYWNPNPNTKSNDFRITTHFNPDTTILKAGKETELIAEVILNKDADYVMINIPIPAGCSYSDKSNNYPGETHREYFRNETAIFCEHLSKGTHKFTIRLMPRYSGSYTLNPARAELMYFPVFSANNEVKKIGIR